MAKQPGWVSRRIGRAQRNVGVSQVELTKEVEAGQAVYSRFVLSIYDMYVHGLSNRLFWKCPTKRLIGNYNRHVSGNHLDVGVGTGFLLDKCRFPVAAPRVGLMDLNSNSLEVTARRISRYRPEVYRRNVLEPIAIDGDGFDSIGINYLLHCLPGSMDEKAVVFDHLCALLNPGGVIFGSTLLQSGVKRGRLAVKVMDVYNRKGIFCNRRDGVDDLEKNLSSRFSCYSVEVVGCAALFRGIK